MTVRAAIQHAREQLIAAGIDAGEASLDAELLARHVLGWDRATLVARIVDDAPAGFEAAYEHATVRRVRREPVAYIVGVQEFWGRDFLVRPAVLIPRPETELIVEETLAWARTRSRGLRIVDIGTGSGCLAITLALELPRAAVDATDVSANALAVARENAERLRARVAFHHGSMLAGIAAPVDAIVSNPPYITGADYETLQPEVRSYEPPSALLGGDDGLDAIRLVAAAAAHGLGAGGVLVMEIGYGQVEGATRIVAETEQLHLLRIRNDLQGTARTLVAVRTSPGGAGHGNTAAGEA
jgi:release factor glutamine methyltransferase